MGILAKVRFDRWDCSSGPRHGKHSGNIKDYKIANLCRYVSEHLSERPFVLQFQNCDVFDMFGKKLSHNDDIDTERDVSKLGCTIDSFCIHRVEFQKGSSEENVKTVFKKILMNGRPFNEKSDLRGKELQGINYTLEEKLFVKNTLSFSKKFRDKDIRNEDYNVYQDKMALLQAGLRDTFGMFEHDKHRPLAELVKENYKHFISDTFDPYDYYGTKFSYIRILPLDTLFALSYIDNDLSVRLSKIFGVLRDSNRWDDYKLRSIDSKLYRSRTEADVESSLSDRPFKTKCISREMREYSKELAEFDTELDAGIEQTKQLKM